MKDTKLTKRYVDSASYEGEGNEQDIRWDSVVPGFGLRLYPSGKKAFVFRYRFRGRKRFVTLGKCGVLTADQARGKAKVMVGELSDGKDPLDKRKSGAGGASMRELCDKYVQYQGPTKGTISEDIRRIKKHFLPLWAELPANSITREEITALHKRIGEEKPYEANRILALLHRMFSLAVDWNYTKENPANKITRFPEVKRDRYVKQEEMERLAAAMSSEKNIYVPAALKLFLYTGLRRSELLQAKWVDVNWERRELRIPMTKAGRTHHCPLSEPAIEILKELPRLADNPYLFPGRKAGSHLINIDKAWRRIRKAADLEDVRLHDLRRTVGSWLVQSGESLPLIGKILGHSNASTTQIYARLGESQPRRALEEHGEKLASLIDKK